MTDQILKRGDWWVIGQSDLCSTTIPYRFEERQDGNINHGFIDLRESPELAETIPEAKKSDGLLKLIKTVAQTNSPLMTSACECTIFDTGRKDYPYSANGFVFVCFKSEIENANKQNLLNLAGNIIEHLEFTEVIEVNYEFTVEPLLNFFGFKNCFVLELKTIGYGLHAQYAWDNFAKGKMMLAKSIANLYSLPFESQ